MLAAGAAAGVPPLALGPPKVQLLVGHRRRGLTEHASDLVLDSLQVGLLVRVDACVASHPEKRLTRTLRVHDLLALANDAESTLCGGLVGLSLTVGDILSDFSDLNLGFVVGFQFIVNFLVALIGDLSQFFAKVSDAVERPLQSLFIGAVLFGDLGSLVGALTKCVSDSVGGLTLLPSQVCRDGLLQCVVKLREVRLDRSAVSNGIIESGH